MLTLKQQKQLKEFLAQVDGAVSPYPEEIDVQTAVVMTRTTPRGTAVRSLVWVSGGILATTSIYAMAMGDREILFAVLGIAKTAFLVGVGGLALGKVFSRSSPGGRRKTDEDDEGSG